METTERTKLSSITDNLFRTDVESDIRSPPSVPSVPTPETGSSFSFFGFFQWTWLLWLVIVIVVAGLIYLGYQQRDNIVSFYDNIVKSLRTPETSSQASSPQTPSPQEQDKEKDEKLNQILNSSLPEKPIPSDDEEPQPPYSADDANSSIQGNKTIHKSGWCYIGEDRGFRACARVKETDLCMSGDIFPNQEICMNPNLRQ
jgi:hypothetical protein